MRRRDFTAAIPLSLVLPAHAQGLKDLPGLEGLFGQQRKQGQGSAQGLAGISDLDANRGLKAALETGALAAVGLLGRKDGFLARPQVRIPLPKALQDVSRLLAAIGLNRQLEELELSMNRAAEQAVPMAKGLLVDAVRTITVADAKKILTGGDTSVTAFFADKTRGPLHGTFMPVVHQATAKVGVVAQYEQLSSRAQATGLYRPEDPTVDHYVTRKALDGLYFMIGEEERKIRRDPAGTGSALLSRVFGAMR